MAETMNWTPDQVKEYLLAIMNERDVRNNHALELARFAIEKRLDAMNEFRAALTDAASTYARKAEVDLRIESLEKQVVEWRGERAGGHSVWAVLAVVAGLLMSAAALAFTILQHAGAK